MEGYFLLFCALLVAGLVAFALSDVGKVRRRYKQWQNWLELLVILAFIMVAFIIVWMES